MKTLGSTTEGGTSGRTNGEVAVPIEAPAHFPLERLLRALFEGGEEGRRRAALFFMLVIGPASIAVTAVLSSHNRLAVTGVRILATVLIVLWLVLRRAPTRVEWAAVILVLIIANVISQISAGPSHAGVFALNALGVFALICVVFDSWLVIASAVLYACAAAVVQFHLYPRGVALAAVLMFAVVLLVMGVVVHGTALYLRTALRRTQLLNQQMEQAAEQERARIAGELHDDTIQVLTATVLQLDDLGRRLQAEGSATGDSVQRTREMLGQALERTRRLTFELYPAKLDERGLKPSLKVLADQVSADAAFDVQLAVHADVLPGPVAQLAYRTIKELLANASKHADASRVDVLVKASDGLLEGEVMDDGCGFEEEQLALAARGHHLGLESTRDRLHAAGGTFGITSQPGKGTRAWFTLPLEPAGADRRPAA
jgi:signal transduction histidine kinase